MATVIGVSGVISGLGFESLNGQCDVALAHSSKAFPCYSMQKAGVRAPVMQLRQSRKRRNIRVVANVSNEAQMQEKPNADPKTVLSIILGGGAGTRLFPLTGRRAKPAVPIGGAYRLIDVPMSNCINSGINKVFILTQFNSQSLNRHISKAYGFGNGVNFGDGFVEVLAATQTPGQEGMNWFQGTADAVRQFVWLFEDPRNKFVENVIILSGDHLYRMNYMDFVQKHINTEADITISCVPMDDSRASDFGLMKIDDHGRVLYFSEKPKGDDLKQMQVDTTVLGLSPEEADKKPYIASMGIYVFKTDILLNLLRRAYPTANDFGSEIIPASTKECNVQAYLFNDYWEDIGTIKSFFEANLALGAQHSLTRLEFEFDELDHSILGIDRATFFSQLLGQGEQFDAILVDLMNQSIFRQGKMYNIHGTKYVKVCTHRAHYEVFLPDCNFMELLEIEKTKGLHPDTWTKKGVPFLWNEHEKAFKELKQFKYSQQLNLISKLKSGQWVDTNSVLPVFNTKNMFEKLRFLLLELDQSLTIPTLTLVLDLKISSEVVFGEANKIEGLQLNSCKFPQEGFLKYSLFSKFAFIRVNMVDRNVNHPPSSIIQPIFGQKNAVEMTFEKFDIVREGGVFSKQNPTPNPKMIQTSLLVAATCLVLQSEWDKNREKLLWRPQPPLGIELAQAFLGRLMSVQAQYVEARLRYYRSQSCSRGHRDARDTSSSQALVDVSSEDDDTSDEVTTSVGVEAPLQTVVEEYRKMVGEGKAFLMVVTNMCRFSKVVKIEFFLLFKMSLLGILGNCEKGEEDGKLSELDLRAISAFLESVIPNKAKTTSRMVIEASGSYFVEIARPRREIIEDITIDDYEYQRVPIREPTAWGDTYDSQEVATKVAECIA
ncbi:hypothetical protein KI387_001632 [Taxus chinensis]|uniref:glucose-1-phosphate adenylyltransferase n=1 Tax=Taxus chinensis TaxID=29808 RepID=A0AA38LMR1_TAXCH|nr:hypothetical protein KI387_001632 [Taxus chinensis]